MPKTKKNGKKTKRQAPFGLSCMAAFKSKSESSKRTVAGINVVKATLEQGNMTASQARRFTKKNEWFKTIPTADWIGEMVLREKVEGSLYTFAPKGHMLLVDNEEGKGHVHWMDDKVDGTSMFSSFLVPDCKTAGDITSKNCDAVTEVLELLQKSESDTKRSALKTGDSDVHAKYAVFGIKVLQAKGFSWAKVYKKSPKAARVLEKWARRLEHVAAKCILPKWLRGMKKAAKVTTLETIKRCVFGAGIASSINYQAPSHTDKDCFLSVHQLNVKGRYGDKEIAQYFCFPSCGYAVALRPGDVLVFNPLVPHCLSARSPEYATDRVHVSTLYVKTSHMSKNDCSKTLTEEEQEYYNLSFDN